MTYQVLARKWRPKDFASLVGQEHVVRALTHALDGNRLHHAYLFTGTRGVGKTTLARIFAKALNCETGVTSTPCGACRACREIDEGRFVDYVEMDAASNRGVDEMAALLERAVYAPVDARFKVYMIDEVHMLTNHAFNAMLKTLEEPPAHVKFILATTDPQKIPVTVLSRCLQFNLKQMPAGHIVAHLEHILGEEKIACEPQALRLLARAASGSMRDALSLTDQAIAYAAGEITQDAVSAMLGALDARYLLRLIDALVARDGAAVLTIADEMALRSLSFSTALQDLAGLFHRIAWAQFAPASVLDEWPEADDLRRLAAACSPEQVQLYYQIATLGRSELGLAPDEYAGFMMTLLRMLAFAPAAGGSVPAPGESGSGARRAAAGSAGAVASATEQGARAGAASASARDAARAEGVRAPDVGPTFGSGRATLAAQTHADAQEGRALRQSRSGAVAGAGEAGGKGLAAEAPDVAPVTALPAASVPDMAVETSFAVVPASDADVAETLLATVPASDGAAKASPAVVPAPAAAKTLPAAASAPAAAPASGVGETLSAAAPAPAAAKASPAVVPAPAAAKTLPAAASAPAAAPVSGVGETLSAAAPAPAAAKASPATVPVPATESAAAQPAAAQTSPRRGGASAALDVLRRKVSSDAASSGRRTKTGATAPEAPASRTDASGAVSTPAPISTPVTASAPEPARRARAAGDAPSPPASVHSQERETYRTLQARAVPPWEDALPDDAWFASSGVPDMPGAFEAAEALDAADAYDASARFVPLFDEGDDGSGYGDFPTRPHGTSATPPASSIDVARLPPGIALDALLGFAGDWPALAATLALTGIAHQLAFNSELGALDGATDGAVDGSPPTLRLSVPVPQYADAAQVAKLKAALVEKLGRPLDVQVEIGPARRTAAALDAAARAQRQRDAEREIDADPFVQQLVREFGASIVPGSVKPLSSPPSRDGAPGAPA